MYRDRKEASKSLSRYLNKYRNKNGVVLAIPRGGVPIGYYIAKELNFPLDVALIKKIGHPTNKEFAVGALNIQDQVINPSIEVDDKYIEKEAQQLRQELRERYDKFTGGRDQQLALEGKIAIITDDGLATGSTMLATIQLVKKKNPSKIVVAIPVGPPRTIRKIQPIVDEVICPEQPENFMAVGQFYDNFEQVTDDEAIEMLQESNHY